MINDVIYTAIINWRVSYFNYHGTATQTLDLLSKWGQCELFMCRDGHVVI